MASVKSLLVKVQREDEVRRFNILININWEDFSSRIEKLFSLSEVSYALKYKDDDGDDVSVDSQAELEEAIRLAKETSTLRIKISKPLCRNIFKPLKMDQQPANNNPKRLNLEKKVEKDKKDATPPAPRTVMDGWANKSSNNDPPQWFTKHMDKFTTGLFSQLEHLPNQTISGVLTGLDNLVVQHLCGDLAHRQMPAPDPYQHPGILCDHCNSPIIGIRYKCGNCEDFDLCEFCESQRTHDEEHIFLKVRKPCPNIGLDKNGRKKAIIKKNQYLKSEAACGSDEEESHAKDQKTKKRKHNKQKKQQKDKEGMIVSLQKKLEDLHSSLVVNIPESPPKKAESPMVVVSHSPKVPSQFPESPISSKSESWDAKLIDDGNLPEMSTVKYGCQFTKIWIVRNSGNQKWINVWLKHMAGDPPSQSEIPMPDLDPGEEYCVNVDFSANTLLVPGQVLTSSFRFLMKGNGFEGARYFGDRLWLSVVLREEVEFCDITAEGRFTEDDQVGCNREPDYDLREADPVCLSTQFSTPSVITVVGEEPQAESPQSDAGFIVIDIPKCFDPNVPLRELGDHATPPGWEVLPSVNTEENTPTSPPSDRQSTNSPPRAHSDEDGDMPQPFRLDRPTLRDARFREPLTIATGVFNTMTNFVKDNIHFKKQNGTGDTHCNTVESEGAAGPLEPSARTCDDSLSDEEFHDVEEEARNGDLNESEQVPDSSPTAAETGDTTQTERTLPKGSYTFSHKKYTPPQSRWTPKPPKDQIEELVSMGFGNRELNQRLLIKHNGHLRAVVNELLDKGQ